MMKLNPLLTSTMLNTLTAPGMTRGAHLHALSCKLSPSSSNVMNGDDGRTPDRESALSYHNYVIGFGAKILVVLKGVAEATEHCSYINTWTSVDIAAKPRLTFPTWHTADSVYFQQVV
jgi:hypothetical protein